MGKRSFAARLQQLFSAHDMTLGAPWKRILEFAIPMLIGNLAQQLYNTADAIIVGRFVGKEALAAVGGTTGTLINLFVNFLVGISSGVTVVIAQNYGAQRYDRVHKTVHSAITLALIAGTVMTVVGLVAAPWALRAMGTPEDIIGYATTYIRIYFFSIPAAFVYNVGAAILRATGDTRRPLYFLIIACLTNIVLDLTFVVWLDLGVWGAAVATLISQILSAVLALFVLVRTESACRLSMKDLGFDPELLKGILWVGCPAGIQSNMYTISNIIIQSCINSFGTDTIAAWTAFGKVDGFFWMILGAYGISITTFVGQNFGAQKYDRIRHSVRVCMMMAMGTALVLSLLLYTCYGPIFLIFTDDAGVLATCGQMVHVMVPFYFTFVFVEILSGAIRGTGDVVKPMIITCGGVCMLRILWLFFALPLHRTLNMVLVSYPITWIITAVLFIIYYLRGRWLKRRIETTASATEEKPVLSAP